MLISLFLSSSLIVSEAFSESVGDLSARIDDIEKKVNGQTSNGDEAASKEELDLLRGLVRELRGEIEELRHSISTGGSYGGSVKPASTQNSLDEEREKSKTPLRESPSGAGASKALVDIGDDDIDDLLKNLGGGRDVDPKNKNKDDIRDKATHDAEKNAPTGSLESGDSSAQYNQALSLYKAKEYAEAEESFRYYLTQFKSGKQQSQAKLKVAQCQLALAKENKDKTRAREASKEFASLYKANSKGGLGAEALLGMGDAMGVQGESKKACVVLKKLKADFPNDKEICKRASELIKQYEGKNS